MENSNEILNELQNISPLVAAIGKANVFNVPEEYFESISGTVMLSINEEWAINNNPVIFDGADVPENYFQHLPGQILAKIKQQGNNELPAIFSTIQKDSPLQVPGNYFESLADDILNRIKNTQVPDSEEGEEFSGVLKHLKIAQPFSVPANYFEELPLIILKKTREHQAAGRMVTMPKRFSVLRYAAAAVITGAIALSVYKYTTQPPVNNQGQPVSVAMDPSIEKGSKMDEQKFNEELNTLSADAIVNYLQKNSSETDIAALSSNVEETNLPDEEEYLLDDKTLDKFLKEIETQTN